MKEENGWKKETMLIGMAALVLAVILFFPSAAMETDQTESSGIVMEENVIANGSITDTVTWKILEEIDGSHTLIIGGTGPMADYKKKEEQPWLEWKSTIETLIIEDGVTRIGNCSMYGLGLKEVRIGKGVETIGSHSFAYGTKLESVVIPGNVKTVEANAFVFHYQLRSVTLEEGVEVLGHSAFGTQPKTGDVFHIPASLRQFDDLAVWHASEYTVAEDNPYFMAADGVLYNKDFTALVDYPKLMNSVEYRVPDSVCELKKGSLQRIRGTKRIHIPSTVQIMPESYLFQWSEMEEVYVDDGVPLSGHTTFFGCSKLASVRLPENIAISKIYNTVQQGCNNLEYLKIPNGVQNIEKIGTPLKGLRELFYDAANAVIKDSVLLDTAILYELTVGGSVEYIPAEFKWLSSQAEKIHFTGQSLFTVEKNAFMNQAPPLSSLEGRIYVDEQGVLYQLDEENGTAKIVHYQGEYGNIYIPAVISPTYGEEYKVTALGQYGFQHGDYLESVYFESPQQIVLIDAYGFAECETLKSVNDLQEKSAVTALFENADIGYRPYHNTGLLDGEEEDAYVDGVEQMASCKELILQDAAEDTNLLLSLESEGQTMEWLSGDGQQGCYQLLTGDTMTIIASAGNKAADENHRYRIYMQKDSYDCSLSISPGHSYTFDDQNVDCFATEDPNCLYIEFFPGIGKTMSIPITALYPSPSSGGGSLTIWAVSLDGEEAGSTEGKMLFSELGAIKARWTTLREEFTLSKTGTGAASIMLKGTAEGHVIPGADFNWSIVLKRQDETVHSYGKDYVRRVVYKDRMVLPEGVSWNPEVVSAIKSGDVRRSGTDYYAGERRICRIGVNGGQIHLSGVEFQWDEEKETGMVGYTVTNTDLNAQMNTNTVTPVFYAEAFLVDLELFSITEEQPVINQIEAEVMYQHSDSTGHSAQAQKTLKAGNGSVKLSKSTITTPYFFGEDVDYEIKLYNPDALPYMADTMGSWQMKEELSPYIFLEAEDMERMFSEDNGRNLSVLITGAELVPWEEKDGALENSLFWQQGANSGVNLQETADQQLLIEWNEEGNALCVKQGETIYEESSLDSSLKKAGFAPGRWTQYTLYWKLNGAEEYFCLSAGEEKLFRIYGKAKDTFQMLSEDWPGAYPTDASLTLTCTANVLNGSNTIKAKASVKNQVKREAYIRKCASIDQSILKESFTAEDGSLITYRFEYQHYGQGQHTNLPFVDEMYGAQALLASVQENPHLAGNNLEVYRKDETDYYILREGIYDNVILGGTLDGQKVIAAQITVEKAEENRTVQNGEEIHTYNGFYTKIRWNFSELPSGNYRLSLFYHGIVDQQISGDNVYSLGNVIWANDRKQSRIYSSLWGGGSIIDFYKDIVETKGTEGKEDVIDSDGYSLINAGDHITYRLTLRCKGAGEYKIDGSDMIDALPTNGQVFLWEAGKNVFLTYESTHESTQITGLNQWTISDSVDGEEKEGLQYIEWSDETAILFEEQDARVYIYVTLTYPDLDSLTSLWESYVEAVKGSLIENTFYVYGFPVNITHHLNSKGEVLLQKGVYGLSYSLDGRYMEVPGRNYYNNRDSQNRFITYYLVLYNGAPKRWYLNDIYDQVPAGFTMKKLLYSPDLNQSYDGKSITSLSDFSDYPFVETESNLLVPPDVVYRSANVQWGQTEEGFLRFRLGAGTGESPLSYDEKRQQYYLNHNEAVVFGYLCEIGLYEETEESAVNTAFMHYDDYPKTGIAITDDGQIEFRGKVNEVYGDYNDGTCSIYTGEDIKNQYELIYGAFDDSWILSDTSIVRGEIIPGITKYTQSYTSPGNGVVTEYTNAVGPYDQINWRVRLHNSGTLAVTDYTFEDILPASYALCGTMRYEIYDYAGNKMKSYDLLNVSERTDSTVSIINNNSNKVIDLSGEMTQIFTSGNSKGTFALSKTENGNEKISIHFSSHTESIPEGGYMDLFLSTYNPTNQYKNSVYTNQAYFIPNTQLFELAGQGSIVKDQEGNPISVKNNAPVTVSFGYATGSVKSVCEEADTDNNAASTSLDENYILLSSKDSVFTYSLSVTNDTEKGMEKLIFIDNLPEKGDGNPFDNSIERKSEFEVRFAEEPDVKVVVNTKEGESYELLEEEYQVDYTEKTDFTEEDWSGESTLDAGPEQARSIRVSILDETGTRIPAGAKVTVSFRCKKEGEVKAGMIGWNSFGYRYKLTGLAQELEAMPLPVGVKFPEAPVLKKYVEDRNGNPYEVPEDTEFEFVIYEGDEIKPSSEEDGTNSKEAITEYLEEHNIKHMICKVSVNKGMSESEQVILDSFDWISGQTYHMFEMESGLSYELKNINGIGKEEYSFVYEKDKEIVLTCRNICKDWTVEIIKTDEDGETGLEGAEFALYSPSSQDCINPDEKIDHNGQSWWLKDVCTTDSFGKIVWNQLKEDKYFILEVKAPDGYNRQEEGFIVYGKNTIDGIYQLHVINEKGTQFPKTGGSGTEMFVAVGTILSGAVCVAECAKKRKKKRGEQ